MIFFTGDVSLVHGNLKKDVSDDFDNALEPQATSLAQFLNAVDLQLPKTNTLRVDAYNPNSAGNALGMRSFQYQL